MQTVYDSLKTSVVINFAQQTGWNRGFGLYESYSTSMLYACTQCERSTP